ncbi:MAG: hypothetical protein E4H05_04790 [Acidimicrobiales bacterium]|nr:MAG: hypothetical protein E4H05_04790 [Acidimicrobiales bacterium]
MPRTACQALIEDVAARRRGGGCYAQVQIDVRIDSEQKVLGDEMARVRAGLEREAPRVRDLRTRAPTPACVEVALGEQHVETLHPFAVGELVVGDSLADAIRHCPVDDREVPGGILDVESPVDLQIHRGDGVVDRFDVSTICHFANVDGVRELRDCRSMSAKPPRLVLSELIDLPVVEASGLTVRRADQGSVVIVIGDRTADLGACRIDDDGALGDWITIDLSELPGWPLPDGDSQFESIAADGGSLVALMCEDPPIVLVADTVTRELRAEIALTAPKGSLLDGQWDDSSSRGEGLVLLRGGRLLVAQEKRPRALIEFGPIGAAAQGLSAGDFLGPDESWKAPHGQVEFVPLSVWKLKGGAQDALGDISSIGAGVDGSLWLLSDKSQRVDRLALDDPLSTDADRITELAEIWDLPDGVVKPEGIAALGDGRVLVAMDTRSTSGNGMIVTRPG